MGSEKTVYPSDISREQFAQILPLLESAKKRTSPRELDLYEVFNAILYLLRESCRWRSLPKEYPDWQAVYYYFRIWKEPREKEPSLLEEVLKKIGLSAPSIEWEAGSDKFHHH